MRLYLIVAWIGMLTINSSALSAQQASYTTLTITDGLSQGMIYDILQDRQGFIWIATKDGLNRYNGYEFKLFIKNPADNFSLSDNIVTCLLEDSSGRIWAGTETGGINLFIPQTERFYHLPFDLSTPNNIRSTTINSIVQENDTTFWAATANGIERITLPKGNRVLLKLESDDLSPIAKVKYIVNTPRAGGIQQLLLTKDRQLISNQQQGIYKLDRQTEKMRPVHQDMGIGKISIVNAYYRLYELPDSSLAATASDTVFIYKDGQLDRIPLLPEMEGSWVELNVDKEGQIWGVSNNILFKLRPGQPPGKQLDIMQRFEEDWLETVLFVDRDGLVWVGSNGYGLRLYNPRAKYFRHQLRSLSTRQLYFDRKDRLWVWNGGQLRLWNVENEEWSTPAPFPSIVERCNRMLNSPDGNFWFRFNIKEEGLKLIRFHPEKNELQYIPYDCPTPPYIPMNTDKHGNIWMPCQDSRIALLKPGADRFEYIDLSGVFPEGYNNTQINSMLYLPEKDAFWAGTQYGLVYLQLQANGKLLSKYYKYDEKRPENPVSAHILCVIRASGEKLWLGTRGGGLSLFDPETVSFNNYTQADGLPNNVVYSIQKDSSGQLWLSTNRGLSCFDPDEKQFRNFTARDGLQADEFNASSFAQSSSGLMVFGGVNGINSFYPEQVKSRIAPPAVKITAIDINNDPTYLKREKNLYKPANRITSLRLSHNENLISIRFAALQYADPSEHLYQYQMAGIDNSPLPAQKRREVTYANLQPGNYTFKVWGKSQGGQWSKAPTELNLHISPPFWRTTAAYMLYFLLAAGLIYLMYRFQIRRAKLRNQLAYEQREAERLAELSRLKSDFFSNITHEFRTPLTLIYEPARQLLKRVNGAENRNTAHLISKNAQQLLQLVNQLLDVNKIEAGAMPVKYEAGNLDQLLQRVFSRYQELAQRKEIHLSYQADTEQDTYDALLDKDKLDKITSNLLANAMKFTPEGGKVSLKCKKAAGYFTVEVQDTGHGIPEDEQEQIFKRFYQVRSDHTQSKGTGIGLALSKELAKMIDGNISVNSQLGKGARFTLSFPVKQLLDPSPKPGNHTHEALSVPPLTKHPDTSPSKEKNSDRLRVLIVEDNPDLRVFIRTVLGQEYQIEEAENGRDGYDKAIALLPDLVVSDIMMPIMDGYELTKRLKEDERTSHIPVVLLTAKSATESRLQGYRQGADAYLEKPFYSEELLIRIQQLIAIRQRLQEKYTRHQLADRKSDMPDIEQKFLKKLDGFIDKHLSNTDFNAEDLARLCHLSRSQLHRKLKAVTGLSATAFIRSYRLDRSRSLLMEGMNVSEVSYMVGFSSPQYFSTRFKEKFGISPSNLQNTGDQTP